MKIPATICFVYGVLLIFGGVMGFAMAKSIMSLVAGGGGGLLMLVAGRGFKQSQSWALPVGLVISLAVGGHMGSNIGKPVDIPQGTSTEEKVVLEKKHEKAQKRAMGIAAVSTLAFLGLLATGRKKESDSS